MCTYVCTPPKIRGKIPWTSISEIPSLWKIPWEIPFRDFERFFRWRIRRRPRQGVLKPSRSNTSASTRKMLMWQNKNMLNSSKFYRNWTWSQTNAAKNTLICFFVFLYVSHCFSRELEPRKIGTFSSRIGTFDFTSWLSIWPCHRT